MVDPPQSSHAEQSDSIFGQKQHLDCNSANVVWCSNDAVEFGGGCSGLGDGGNGLGDGGELGGSGGGVSGGSIGQGGRGGEAGGSKGGLVGRIEQNLYR